MLVSSLKQLNRAVLVLVQIGFFSLALMVSYEVLGRYIFHAPTAWAEETGRLVLIWCICLGVGPIYASGKMVSMDFFTDEMAERRRMGSAWLLTAAIGVLCFAVVIPGWDLAAQSYQLGARTSEMLHLPEVLFQASVPAGFALLGLNAFVAALRLVDGLILGKAFPDVGFAFTKTPSQQED